MNYRILLFLLLFSCTTNNLYKNEKKETFHKGFINSGFALIYHNDLKKNKLVSQSLDNESLLIFQKNLKKDTHVKITNPINNKSIIAIVGSETKYPDFFNSVISSKISKEIELDNKEPYVTIAEINTTSIFIANKSKTFDEEKKVAGKAPVENITIKSIGQKNLKKKTSFKKSNFNYIIKIADLYFEKSAYALKKRILNETKAKNIKISMLSKTTFRVYLGPFNNLASLKKAFDDIRVLDFENIEIIKK